MIVKLGVLLCFATVSPANYKQVGDIQGITFANASKEVYVPIREFGTVAGMPVEWHDAEQKITFHTHEVDQKKLRKLWDGTNLMPLSALKGWGIDVVQDLGAGRVKVTFDHKEIVVDVPPKYVQVSLMHQELRAWQGTRQIMVTNVSSGAPGNRTPQGSFKAGPAKNRHHYSRLYNNSYMPFAVQINGNIFIHGYKSVPRRPASHGCVRMPLTGKNAARYFFDWVSLGTPVDVVNDWTDQARTLMAGSSGD